MGAWWLATGASKNRHILADNLQIPSSCATTSTEVDEGSPVVLDSDLDDFRSPELQPTLVRRGDMGGQINRLVRIEEESLDEVEALVLNGVAPLYNDQVVHRLVPIEDSPPYEDSPRYSSVEL